VPEERIAEMLPVMPSKRLIIHQWRKHGSCSGLTQDAYFDLTRELFARIRIPARYIAPSTAVTVAPGELVDDFARANAWLEPSMMAVDCGNRRDRGRLEEIRICFSRQGDPRPCGANEHRQCRATSLVLPPVR
jgi:ribonuclease T2